MNLSKSVFGILAMLTCAVHAVSSNNVDSSPDVDPTSFVDYVINYDENQVKKEDMETVAEWLKQRKIEVKESELASYAAYQVAAMNRQQADDLMAFGKEGQLHIEEVEPDYLDWSDLDKEDL